MAILEMKDYCACELKKLSKDNYTPFIKEIKYQDKFVTVFIKHFHLRCIEEVEVHNRGKNFIEVGVTEK